MTTNGLIKRGTKGVALINMVALVINMSLMGVFFISPAANAVEDGLCSADVSVVLVIDKSASMDEGGGASVCVYEVYNPIKLTWYERTLYALSEAECDAYSQPGHPAIFTPPTLSKLEKAKDAAQNFLSYLGAGDQSAVVSYNSSATVDKGLSNGHALSSSIIELLSPSKETNIGGAIDLANIELESANANPQAVKAMILLTDGRANKPDAGALPSPYTDPEDYALGMATEAAGSNIKIFTIGLGADINESILQDIAEITGAKKTDGSIGYYEAPDEEKLESIYNNISEDLCEFSSISGCKFGDVDGDGVWDTEESGIVGWEIFISGQTAPQLTDTDGCYKFSGLNAGDYTITEGVGSTTDGFVQTFPYPDGFYDISLGVEEDLTGYHFGNQILPENQECGNGITEAPEKCDAGVNNGVLCQADYGDTCTYCTATCDEVILSGPYCGDNILNGSEECDGDEGVGENQVCSEACELISLDDCGDGVIQEPEECDSGEGNGLVCQADYGMTCQYCTSNCTFATASGGTCGDGVIQEPEECDDGNSVDGDGCSANCTTESGGNGTTTPVCGNGILESGEECDDGNLQTGDGCDQYCVSEPLPSGGSGFYPKYSNQGSTDSSSDASAPSNGGSETIVLGETGAPLLVIEKSVDPIVVNQGEKDVEFTIIITNNGNLTAYNAVASDLIPGDFSFVAESDKVSIASVGEEGAVLTSYGLGAEGAIKKTWDLGDIHPGEIHKISYSVNINDDARAGMYSDPAKAVADNHAEIQDSAELEVKTVAVLSETGASLYEMAYMGLLSILLLLGSAWLKRTKLA